MNTSYLAVLLAKNSQSNPDNLPLEWHIDSRNSSESLDPELESLGYILMTTEEFEQRQLTYYDEFINWRNEKLNVPQEISLWQFRAVLKLMNLFDKVNIIIDQLPYPLKSITKEQWEYGNIVQRNHPVIVQLGSELGLSSSQIDDIFKTANSFK